MSCHVMICFWFASRPPYRLSTLQGAPYGHPCMVFEIIVRTIVGTCQHNIIHVEYGKRFLESIHLLLTDAGK